MQRLANEIGTEEFFLGESTIRLQDQRNCLTQVHASLLEGFTLRVGTREFLDEADVALGNLAEDGVS